MNSAEVPTHTEAGFGRSGVRSASPRSCTDPGWHDGRVRLAAGPTLAFSGRPMQAERPQARSPADNRVGTSAGVD